VYRLGAGKAKRMMLTGGKIDRKEAGKFGLVVKPVRDNTLNAEVETMTEQMSRAPINQPELRCTKW
jgi:enoyl-CoA hydratase